MRVDVSKVLFIGVESERTLFFEKAQEKGLIEFISTIAARASQDPEIQKFAAAIKVLRSKPVVEQVENIPYDSAGSIAQKIIDEHSQLLKRIEEERLLELEIERVDFFGNFSLEDVAYIEKKGHVKFRYFYQIVQIDKQNDDLDDDLIYLGQEAGIQYFVSLDNTDKQYHNVNELKIEKPEGQLKADLEFTKNQIDSLDKSIKELARFNSFLHSALIERMNTVDLEIAKTFVEHPIEGKLFAVEAWVPKTKLEEVQVLSDSMNTYMQEVEIEPQDVIPTYLENKGDGRIGEDLVHIYDTPSITDKDPSNWVLWSFIIFFAMIINDSGYGLVFLLLTLYLKYKFPNVDNFGKRMIKLSIMLSSACIIWGVFTTSFFGINVRPDNPIRKASLVDWLVEKKAEYHIKYQDETYNEWVKEYPQLKDVKDAKAFVSVPKSENEPNSLPIKDDYSGTVMFEFSLIIGTIHVILSILRNLKRSWSGIGWILFMLGSYCYFPIMLHSVSMIHYAFGLNASIGASIGMDMMQVGVILALGLALVQKKFSGALEFMVVIQIFCDVLSYLRLYALGLAGMMMGSTFNEMAEMTGVVFGTLIVIFGHTINMTMAIMGGVIHGLRLNFLEWYHYSFEGGGRNFKPLKLYKK
jgi:V/A-type H+-transporting ATPase subunit I